MQINFTILQHCQLFAGITEANLKSLLDCLSIRQKYYEKNSFIFFAEEKTDSIGIVLTGAVHVLRDDFWGKRKIIERVGPGGMFGVAFACAGIEKLPVSVLAAEESDVMFVNCKRIISACTSACAYHNDLIRNLTLLLAGKSIALVQKLEHITQATTREKLLSYLSAEAQTAGNNKFTIPFNREELADYLSVERSAMSAELSKMRNEGMIVYQKNHFELLKGI